MTTPAQSRPAVSRPQMAITDLPWPRALQVVSSSGSHLVISTAVLLIGWAVAEESGTAPFRIGLFNGRDASGARVATIGAAASGASVCSPGWPGIPVPDGLYLSLGTGTFHGALWVIPVPGGVF